MRARIVDQPAIMYGESGASLLPVTELAVGSEVELGRITKRSGRKWLEVALFNGQQGYLSADTKVFHLKQATLVQKEVDVHAVPSVQSASIAQFKKNARFYLLETVRQGNETWVKVRDCAGREGFIDGRTKFQVAGEATKPSKDVAKKHLIWGGVLCVVGTVVTAATYWAAQGGGTYIVAWGAILAGVVQLVIGIRQLVIASGE